METQPDALYAGLVGTLTSAVMNLPGEAYTLARKNKPGAVPGAQQSGNSAPRLFTRDEVQGMSAGEVSENYDAIRESMGLWDKDGELPENMPESGTVDVPAVDSESPAGDNGENIDFYVAPNGKVLPAEYKGWIGTNRSVPFPVSWTVKMKKKQKETQDILSYHSQAAGCSDKARAKASGGRQPIEECGRTGL